MQNESKTQRQGGASCQNCKKDFTIYEEDLSFYEKIQVPPPTFCPECRMIRRFAFRNQRKIFRVNDHFTSKPIFSLIPPDSGVPVITQEEWFGDTWEGLDFGTDYDFNKNFFVQLFELHSKIPQLNLNCTRMINSAYSGNANDLKNCYMIFNAADNENCMYGTGNYGSKYCVDNSDIYDSEFCYENFWLKKCNKVHFSEECTECHNVILSKNCVGCMDCIGCVNLRNKSHHIFNVEYSKEEYEEKLKELKLDTYTGLKEAKNKAREFWNTHPKKFSQGVKNVNSTGVYVTNSKNVKDSYLVSEAEDIRYSQYVSQPPNKDCYDISVWGDGSELAYEYSSSGSGVYNSKFIIDSWPNIRNAEYSLHCNSSSDLFGCVGLRNKQYCIFNKQYSKEEYFKLVEKIKSHMNEMPYIDKNGLIYKYGEFFPIEFTWYGYNNTMAQEFFPISEEESASKHYPWYESKTGEYKADIQNEDLPDDIASTDETIVNKVINCSTCTKFYRILPEEFSFLKSEGLPLPRMCIDCRHETRFKSRIQPKLFKRSCMNTGCPNTFETGFDPKNKEIVYCEKCYQQEVY